MTTVWLTSLDELRLLPDGALLVVPGRAEPILWLRAYLRPHPDPDPDMWRLPINPFAEHHITEIEARLPDSATQPAEPEPLRGDEDWLSTLSDLHDSSR